MRISGTETSSLIIRQRKNFKMLKVMPQKCQNKVRPKGMV